MQSVKELKEETRPLLTIAVPTYNRASYLDLCLKRISEELDSLSADMRKLVKVYVSDNLSTDNTSEVISRHRLMNAGAFETVRNAVNIGADCNIVQCYLSATTPYVWVLGDDDVMLENGLRLVLDVLANQELDILYAKGYSYSDDYLDEEPRRGRGKSGLVEYSDALDFVRNTHVMLTFITALIVRSGVVAASDIRLLEGSNLSQLSWVLPLIRDGKKFAIIENRIYAAKIANSGGYGVIDVFGNNLDKAAKTIFMSRPELARAIQNGTIVTWFPTYLMTLRAGKSGFSKKEVKSKLKQLYGGNWRYYFFLAPLLSLPMRLAQAHVLLIRLVRLLFLPVLI